MTCVTVVYLKAKASTTLGRGSTAANELNVNANIGHAKEGGAAPTTVFSGAGLIAALALRHHWRLACNTAHAAW
jgi:hypothetical protein